jgi:hypothetical protein
MADSPFEEDCALLGIMARFRLELDRRQGVEITDDSGLEAAGLIRKCPDYSKIRRLLNDGVIVPGARLSGVEYIIRKKRDGG